MSFKYLSHGSGAVDSLRNISIYPDTYFYDADNHSIFYIYESPDFKFQFQFNTEMETRKIIFKGKVVVQPVDVSANVSEPIVKTMISGKSKLTQKQITDIKNDIRIALPLIINERNNGHPLIDDFSVNFITR